MALKITFYPKDSKSEKSTPIRMHLNFSGNHEKIYVGESINPKHWIADDQRLKESKSFPDHKDINDRLDGFRVMANKVYRDYLNDNGQQEPTPYQLKRLIEIALGRRVDDPKMDFFSYFELYIKNQKELCDIEGRAYRDSAVMIYQRSLELLREFARRKNRRIEFETITKDFYYAYVKFLRDDKKLSVNTQGTHLKRLKAVLNSAVTERHNKTLIFRTSTFKVLSEPSSGFYLTEPVLEKLADLELTPGLARNRDMFLIGCWTALRYSDFSRLKKEHFDFDQKLIKIKTKKTGAEVTIPFLPGFQRVIEKYKDGEIPTVSNQKLNENLKAIAIKLVEKLEFLSEEEKSRYLKLSSHTARRTFCSNMYHRGIDIEMIMAISGHKTEREFRRYIKVSAKDKASKFKDQFEKSTPVIHLNKAV